MPVEMVRIVVEREPASGTSSGASGAIGEHIAEVTVHEDRTDGDGDDRR